MIERGCTAVVPPTDDPDILLLLAAAPAIKTHGAARRAPTLRSAPNKRVLPSFLSKGKDLDTAIVPNLGRGQDIEGEKGASHGSAALQQ